MTKADLQQRGSAPMQAFLTLIAAGALLSACGQSKSDTVPTGQVVATVGGTEITNSQLQLELKSGSRDVTPTMNAQQQALNALITRKVLAAEAKKRGLDRSPSAAMYRERGDELVLIQLLEESLAEAVPVASDAEIDEFVSAHPASFAQRRLVSVEQLLLPRVDKPLMRKMQPLTKLDDVEKLLNESRVKSLRSATVLDTMNLNPEIAGKIAAMEPGQMLAMPSPAGGMIVMTIVSSRLQPLAGEEAQHAAKLMLMRQRSGSQVRAAMDEIVQQHKADVKINESFAPAAKNPAGSGT